MGYTRRSFLTVCGGAAVVAAPRRVRAQANDTVRLGIVGMGTRGTQNADAFGRIPGVRIAAVCDPDRERLSLAAERARKYNGYHPVAAATDMRRLLDMDDLDAVVVTTCNHWHGLATVWACEAGKHVYVEKPVAHRLWESQQMIKAAKKHGRIVQAGIQRSSDPHLKALFARLQSGEFGKILRGRAIVYGARGSIGRRDTPLKMPSYFDYDLWAGPAEMRPIYRNALHYDWHWAWDTGNGELGNNGPHYMDLLRAALGVEGLAPTVQSFGGRFLWDDAGDSPNTQVVLYDYKPAPMIAEVRNLPAAKGADGSSKFRGESSAIVVECEDAYFIGLRNGEIRDYDGKVIETFEGDGGVGHQANFIDALRAGDASKLNCPIQIGHVSSGLTLQGNISHKLGEKTALPTDAAKDPEQRSALDQLAEHLAANGVDIDEDQVTVGPKLHFDAAREVFTGDHAGEANAHMKRDTYRAPYVLEELS